MTLVPFGPLINLMASFGADLLDFKFVFLSSISAYSMIGVFQVTKNAQLNIIYDEISEKIIRTYIESSENKITDCLTDSIVGFLISN